MHLFLNNENINLKSDGFKNLKSKNRVKTLNLKVNRKL